MSNVLNITCYKYDNVKEWGGRFHSTLFYANRDETIIKLKRYLDNIENTEELKELDNHTNYKNINWETINCDELESTLCGFYNIYNKFNPTYP